MTLIMGVLNVTDDSFSDGGRFTDIQVAVSHGLRLVERGARIVDVGGESTRPGASRIPAAQELARVLPVIERLAAAGVVVSVDTTRAEVAAAAVARGASIVNDVSGGQADPQMLPLVAGLGVDYVLMHWRGHSEMMQRRAEYTDVVADVEAELLSGRDRALSAGVRQDRIILDPGIGFAKTYDHNWAILRELGRFNRLGHRLLVGVSRKGFLGELLGGRPPQERDAATAAISCWAGLHDVWAVRTHEVSAQVDAVAIGHKLSPTGGVESRKSEPQERGERSTSSR